MNIQDRFRKAYDNQLETFTEEPKESQWPFIGALAFVLACIAVLFLI